MLGKQMLEALVAYDAWATERILDQVARLSQEQLDAATEHGRGSLRAIIFHTTAAMDVWQHVLTRGRRPDTLRDAAECITVEDLRAYHLAINQAAREALARLSEEELDVEVDVPDSRGNSRIMRRWHMLMQPLTHGMQHRAEVAAELTRLGRSPGNLDFIFFAQ